MQLRSGTNIVHRKAPIALFGTRKMETLATANRKRSPLLSLPKELKRMINDHICSNRTIHIYIDNGKLHHSVCKADISASEIEQRFHEAGTEAHRNVTEYTEDAHAACFSTDNDERLDLNFLQTCREWYQEAKDIPTASNTFHFNKPEAFFAFTASLSRSSLPKAPTLLRSLAFNCVLVHPEDERAWAQAIREVACTFKQLRNLHITVEQIFCVCWVEWECQYQHAAGNRLWRAMREDLHRVGSLTNGSVVVRNEGFLREVEIEPADVWVFEQYKWTVEQRRVCAREAKGRMLSSG